MLRYGFWRPIEMAEYSMTKETKLFDTVDEAISFMKEIGFNERQLKEILANGSIYDADFNDGVDSKYEDHLRMVLVNEEGKNYSAWELEQITETNVLWEE